MANNLYAFQPDYVIHPGEYIAELLETMGIKQVELAARMGVTPKHLNNVVNGKASITVDTALLLQNTLGRDSRYWLGLQNNYDIFQAEKDFYADFERERDDYIAWLSTFDYNILLKQKYFEEKYKDSSEISQVKNLLLFFGCADLKSWNKIYMDDLLVACRISGSKNQKIGNTLAWIRYGQISARNLLNHYPEYDKKKFKSIIGELRCLTLHVNDDLLLTMTELCKSTGVILIFQKEIPRSSICGAAFWISESGTPCIILNLRFKNNASFWFAFFHESAHILKEHKKRILLDYSDFSDENELEKEANQYANNTLIPYNEYRLFIDRQKFSKKDIIEFSASVRIHPGIVVGRLQHENKIAWNQLNDLKQRYDWA